LRELKDSHSKIVHIVELGNLGIDLNTPIIDLKDYEEYLRTDSILYDDISQRDIVADTIITSYSRKFDETVKTM
jgi:tRNA (Thr-GGU) A37 N-methylase